MQIASITPARHAEFLALVDAEIRPDRAKTHAWDDFPLILGRDNAPWTLVATTPEGRIVAGLACLIRECTTSCGKIPVAGIGSVVTHPEFRGAGLSAALQNALLSRLRRQNVPLAVLWTDQPEIYAGRGFVSAGWEMHVDLARARLETVLAPGFSAREFVATDCGMVQSLYDRHQLRTLRQPGDAERLYNMPGTRGLVAIGEDDVVSAAVFCGKGADFPDYVAEWSGPAGLVMTLLGMVRERGWARYVLAPAGTHHLVNLLVDAGATGFANPGGYWAVLQPAKLNSYLQAAGVGSATVADDPAVVLGCVNEEGTPVEGAITIGIWGLDSV